MQYFLQTVTFFSFCHNTNKISVYCGRFLFDRLIQSCPSIHPSEHVLGLPVDLFLKGFLSIFLWKITSVSYSSNKRCSDLDKYVEALNVAFFCLQHFFFLPECLAPCIFPSTPTEESHPKNMLLPPHESWLCNVTVFTSSPSLLSLLIHFW